MSAPARLQSVRLVGFKSFAERTEIEFGPGISAIVGPNGSGKSNLADALRWALGEQGRTLRTKRAEDVIFAGSEKRRSTGMADVTVVLDNVDGYLPLDFGQVALGRRVFRSGENVYLLNRQRVRYRDVQDLLEAGNLSDNALLFIGQGMVDQALSLRPEERRELFEEVAGVRRPDRRRRLAEGQLVEAEANLARVEDLLVELRPRARRLAQQMQAEEARHAAASELSAALVAAARARWAASRSGARQAGEQFAHARRAADEALANARRAEERIAAAARRLDEKAQAETTRRSALDEVRARRTETQIAEARLDSSIEALENDRRRLSEEASAVESRLEAARRSAAQPLAEPDAAAEEELAATEARLARARDELERLRAAVHGADERAAAVRRAAATREAERDAALRRAESAARRAAEQADRVAATEQSAAAAAARHSSTATALVATLAAESAAENALEEARRAVATAEGRGAERSNRAAEAASHLETARARLAASDEVLRSADNDALALAARRRGGRQLLDGVEVDRPLQRAIEAALGPAVRSALLPAARVPTLRGERGHLVIEDAPAPRTPDRDASRAADAAREAGGGHLADAVLRDPGGALGRLLAGALWAPGLEEALRLQPTLPAGWCVATPSGDVVTATGVVALGGSPSVLERRDERDALQAAVTAAEQVAENAARAGSAAAGESDAAREKLVSGAERLAVATRERRRAEETERTAARASEAAARELAWESAQRERLSVEQLRATAALDAVHAVAGADTAAVPGAATADFATLEQAVGDLRTRRERLATGLRDAASDRRRAEGVRNRAEASLALDEPRLADIGRDTARVSEMLEARRGERNRVAEQLAALSERETAVRQALDEIVEAGRSDRDELAAAEQQAARSRERLRSGDDAARNAERAVSESRLTEETVREQLLIELAALGPGGLSALTASAETQADSPSAAAHAPAPDQVADDSLLSRDDDDLAAALEAAIDLAITAWEQGGDAPPPPPVGRLATLRRRFHGLGASDPYVTGEYAELTARLDQLEAQKTDLTEAIEGTRSLIAELRTRVFEQFQTAFRDLEGAFERQFTRLFGGGSARLKLTEPDDLETTGIDIAAQPPGKKRQALALLSGGERALTAVALLFAMLEVRPVPFCVLDEVDAALDEVNIDRFVASLRDLAERTQCIVITHNRGTIEAADALHGVTLGADAVSRIVSLRLEDAIQQAVPPVAETPARMST